MNIGCNENLILTILMVTCAPFHQCLEIDSFGRVYQCDLCD